MKKFILALAIVATSFGAFAQTPAAKKAEVKTEKKAAHKAKKASKKAEARAAKHKKG